MKKYFYPFLFLGFSGLFSLLSAQSVALSGLRTDDPDGFSFVVLGNLSAGEIIYFTDNSYQATTNDFNTGETVWTYTVPAGGHSEGVVILVSESSGTLTVTAGSGSAGTISPTTGMELDDLGDELYAFTASNPANPEGSVTEIFSYLRAGSPGVAAENPGNDVDCLCSVEFAAFTSKNDNIQYTGSRDNVTLAIFTNSPNWTVANSPAINNPLSTTSFTNLLFGGTTFPVEWLNFEAQALGLDVELNWSTASEHNNDFFLIERSQDGESFREVGMLEGAGNSKDIQHYSFTDANPDNGSNYYRIRQTDFDGSSSFSKVVIVEMNPVSDKVRMYPNPVVSHMQVESMGGVLKIVNLNGQIVSSTRLQPGRTSVDLSTLESGVYIAEMRELSGVRTYHRLLK